MPNVIQSCTSDLTSIPADGTAVATITAIVVNDEEPPVPQDGVTVNWSANGAGSIEPTSSTTNTKGEATTTLTATGAGEITVTATTEGDETGKSATVTAASTGNLLSPPVVFNVSKADGYTLDQYDIAFGVYVEIQPWDNIEANQILNFNWGGFPLTIPILSEDDLPKIINISADMPPLALADGTYKVSYSVTDEAGNISASESVTVNVVNGGQSAPSLPEPVVSDADPYINIADAEDGVVVTVPLDGRVAGDIVTMYWPAFDKNDNTIRNASTSLTHIVVDGDSSHDFQVEKALFYPNGTLGYEGYVDCYYTITPVNDGGTGNALVSFTKHCRVKTIAP